MSTRHKASTRSTALPHAHKHNSESTGGACGTSISAAGTAAMEGQEEKGGRTGNKKKVVFIVYGKQTCKFFRLTQAAWTCSLTVWICRSIYRWEGPAQTSAFFSLSKAHSGCKKSKKKETERGLSYRATLQKGQTHRHSCNIPERLSIVYTGCVALSF